LYYIKTLRDGEVIIINNDIPVHVVLVEAWIKKDDRFLLTKRSEKDSQAPGKWTVPGGKIELVVDNDIIEHALAREVMEKVGIRVSNPRYFSSRSFLRPSGIHEIGLSFLLDYKSGKAKPLEDQDQVKWVTIDETSVLLDRFWDDVLSCFKKVSKS